MKPEQKIELLRQMKRIRITEETIAERYSEWKMRCPTHLCTGQEAVERTPGTASARPRGAVRVARRRVTEAHSAVR